jgi:DNA invertase Pin-like site-specific DNA recombinase
MLRVGIYARISSDREGDNLAISRQLADCRALAERRGWRVAEEYVDADISAYSVRRRPAYERMVEEIEAGLIDAVIVYHADRLHRHPRELEDFISLCERTSTKMATVSGDVDLSTHEGQLMARIMGAVARKESDDKSRRIRRKHEEIAQAGRPSGGGTRPFGYESDHRTVRPAEAAIIRECAERALAGDSLRSICIDLNERGVETVRGSQWSPQTLRRMLMSGRISGQREHKGEIVAAAEWDAIITVEQTQRLRARLGDPDRRTNRSARRHLLARLLRCELCGTKMVSRPRADGTARYVCATGPSFGGCGKIAINADPLDLVVTEMVLHRLDSPDLAAALNGKPDDPEGAGWQEEIEAARAQLDELAGMWAEREISRHEYLAARAPIEKRETLAKKRLAAINRTTTLADHVGNAKGLRERWPRLTLTRQEQIVAAVIDHVVIAPGRRGYNRFDESRVTPEWRA